MVVTEFNFESAYKEYKQRIQKICDYYQVSVLWAQNMSIEEIEWFEKKIEEEKSNESLPKSLL